MFKLESYLAPLLMSYINKYVKLQQEDFSLSLWGGDAVLNKLDLRLDAIESILPLPVTFKSGHIYELRLHVPWTKLGSEPVVITINTIECILKLRDSAADSGSAASGGSAARAAGGAVKPRVRRQDAEDLPPGYLQSLMNRIVNNVNIVINNLILKFVEDDIVLSVNVKSAECYSVNADWTRAFVELAMPELVLRRVFDFNDLTVCLDRRNASGKIETYQDPLLYRCSLTCRMHMTHDSLHAKMPSIMRFNLLCERLDLSMTDTQVPMFFRLLELCVALYYGTLEVAGGAVPPEDHNASADISTEAGGNEDTPDEAGQGWASWAWSYVPQILPTGEEDEEGSDWQTPRRLPSPPIFSLGFYIRKASVVFKLTEPAAEGASYAGVGRVSFSPCILWEASGIALDVLMRGMSFFNAQFGVTGTSMTAQGDAMCGVSDLTDGTREACFLRSGSSLEEKAHRLVGFMTGSLFDPAGAENQGERPTYIHDEERHLQRYTETFSLVKFGAFWMDYLYTMEEKDDKGDGHSSEASQSRVSDELRENSGLRFVFGPTLLTVSSTMVQRLHKFVYCLGCHDYEPYSKPQKEIVDESRPPPTDLQVRALEEYLPTRTYHVTWTKPIVHFMANDLPAYDVTKRKSSSHRKLKKSKSLPKTGAGPMVGGSGQAGTVRTEAACSPAAAVMVVQGERVDLQITSAMYPRKVVQLVSKMAAPSSNLLHHSHSHCYVKVFSVQAGLSRREATGQLVPIQNIVQPWSGAWYKRTLLFPMYWKNGLQPRQECLYELPHLTVNLTKPQLLLLLHTTLTWLNPAPSPSLTASPSSASLGHAQRSTPPKPGSIVDSLMEDVFKNAEVRMSRRHPVLEVSVSGIEMRDCHSPDVWAVTGTLTATQAMLIHVDAGRDSITPLLYGPLDTSPVTKTDFFTEAGSSPTETANHDLMTFTFQLPETPNMPAAPALLRLDVRGLAASLDPILYEWLKYSPAKAKVASKGLDPKVNIDASLAESSFPLKSQGSQSESVPATLPTDAPSHTARLSASRTPTADGGAGGGSGGRDTGASGGVGGDDQSATGGVTASASGDQLEEEGGEGGGWGASLAHWFPLVKIMEIEIDVCTCCVFFPSRHVRLAEVTMDIPRHLAGVFLAGTLPETIVVCWPSLRLHSAGHKMAPPAVVEIPIRTLEQSVSVEKLPWSVELKNFSVYSLHSSQHKYYLVKPASVSATIAVTTKYQPPTSDNITSLGLCVHADMGTIFVGCSHAQIQQLYDVLLSIVLAGSKMADSVLEQLNVLNKIAQSSVVMETTRPPPLFTPPKASANNRTVSTSSQLDPPVTISETSETASHETTPLRDLEDASSVKLSLWIQWTLPKLVGVIYSLDDTGRDMRVVTEIEDVATSVDVQDVYSKVEVKVGMLNVRHDFMDLHGDTWRSGDHEGLLLSCSDQLSQNVVIVSNKLLPNHGQTAASPFTEGYRDPKPRDKSHGFLTVTYTRALKSNVKKRMKKMAFEGIMEEGSVTSHRPPKVYLNEVCLTVQPCNVIVNCPVIGHVIKVFAWQSPHVFEGEVPAKPIRTQENISTNAPSIPWLTADNLPLTYINTSNLRILIPTNCGGSESEVKREETGGSQCHHDVCIIHLRALTLSPIADNPLPRIVLEKEIYRRALHAGLTQQPGSEVEDRQYQLDVAGLSLSTGRWKDLVVESKRTDEDQPIVQHPALEWNNLLQQRAEKDEVWLVPIAVPFDLRVVAAPAIVYRCPPGLLGRSQPTLVCGHSLEVNATSDMDFYLSSTQIKLAVEVFSTNIAALLGVTLKNPGLRTGSGLDQIMDERREEAIMNDSGVDSETSNSLTGVHRTAPPPVIITSPHMETDIEDRTDTFLSRLVPFDVLLTAGKISFMTYMHKEQAHQDHTTDTDSHSGSSPKRKGDLESKQDPLYDLRSLEGLAPVPGMEPLYKLDTGLDLDLESTLTTADSGIDLEGQPRPTEDQRKGENKAGHEETKKCLYVVPFLYAAFAQPHTMLKIQRGSQKMELSCYDVVLKGTKSGHSFREDQRLLPEGLDYPVHWIETKPGEANPKTGILPSLYTLRATDFLIGPADLLVLIARPLKINVSITRFEQLLTYSQDLLPYFTEMLPSTPGTQAGPREARSTSDQSSFVTSLVHVRSVKLTTVQAMVAMETLPEPKSPGVQLSVGSFEVQVDIHPDHSGSLQSVGANVSVLSLLVKTSYAGHQRPILGPFPASLTVEATWGVRHSGAAQWPAVLAILEAGFVPIYFGQEHVLCIYRLAEHAQNILMTYASSNAEPETTTPKTPTKAVPKVQKSSADLELVPSIDDLRAGDFEYNTEDSGPDLLPRPGEIVFSADSESGPSTMSWCYPEPRAVTFLHVTPVPFMMPQQLEASLIDENLRVPCMLQYWDPLLRNFVDYASFTVSQNEPVSVSLPEINLDLGNTVVTAQIWQAVILSPNDSEEDGGSEDPVEPLLSPMTLAASLRVDSCFSQAFTPALQVALSARLVQLQLTNHYRHLATEVPGWLKPYRLAPSFLGHDHEVAVLTVTSPCLTTCHLEGSTRRLTTRVKADVHCSITDYRSLTMCPLLEQVNIDTRAIWQHSGERGRLRVRADVGPLQVRVGEAAVHTLTATSKLWDQVPVPSGECVIPHYYLICNNTMEAIHVAQVGTDEMVTITSHEVAPYAWRSHKILQLLQVSVEGCGDAWSDPIQVDTEGTTVCVLEHKGANATLIVKVKQLSGVQKQIEISGLLLVASRLNQQLEVKVVPRKAKDDRSNDAPAVMAANGFLPTFIIEPDDLRAVKVKLFGLKTVWSQEVAVTGEKSRESRLVKVPLADKGSFIHVWCHVFTETHQNVQQTIVLFVPLFTVRTHYPAPLMMNVETPRLKSTRREDLKGQGHEQQLILVGGDMTHNITFQLRVGHKPSSPPIALSSGMIEQVRRRSLGEVRAEKLLYGWQDDDLGDTWPYDDIEKITTPELVHSPLGSPPAPKPSQRQEVVMTAPSGEEDVEQEQPNLDLQISLRQRWPGCNTMLIDISPYWLMVNSTDLDLIVLENDNQQWRLPQQTTFAPPVMQGDFQLGLVYDNRLHLSDPIRLSEQEMSFRYLQGHEDTLYRQGHLKLVIPVILNKTVTHLCELTLHSVYWETLRVVTVRETYVFSNLTGLDLQVQAFSLPLSQQKVQLKHELFSTQKFPASHDPLPLPLWHCPADQPLLDNGSTSDVTQVHYISLCCAPTSDVKDEVAPWALPCRIRFPAQGARCSVSLPLGGSSSSSYRTFPSVLVTHQRAGLVYLTLSEDSDPGMEIHNRCDFTLVYGQALIGVQAEEMTVQEEAELTTTLPTVPPGGSVFYTFPAINEHFPELGPLPEVPRFHLAGCRGGLPDRPGWSVGLDLTSEHDVFVNIPDVSDVKVHLERVGHTLHLFVDPVSRAEVSAKEIRSRIKGRSPRTVVVSTSSSKTQSVSSKDRLSSGSETGPSSSTADRPRPESDMTKSPTPSTCDPNTGPEKLSKTETTVIKDGSSKMESAEADLVKPLLTNVSPTEITPPHVNLTPEVRHTATVSTETSTEPAGGRRAQPGRGHSPRGQTGKSSSSSVEVEATRPLLIEVVVLCSEGAFVLVDESTNPKSAAELVRVTTSKMAAFYLPDGLYDPFHQMRPHLTSCLTLTCSDLQIDNQMYSLQTFDFPVIFQRQNSDSPSLEFDEAFNALSPAEQATKAKEMSLTTLELTLCTDLTSRSMTLTGVRLALLPISVFIEDIFVYHLLNKLEHFMASTTPGEGARSQHHTPPVGRRRERRRRRGRVVPQSVGLAVTRLGCPVRLHSLVIEPLSLLFSMHASLKLFVGADNTPLRFSRFSRSAIFSAAPQLVRAAAMHYATGALLRAGWVVGSLEILGNPTGLVRNVGQGLSDMVWMPYQGLRRGPAAFVGGVTHGLSSLLRHVSTGALTSVTNFASSVSRNMDRLSLDAAHRARQEEARRHRPRGISDGLVNGLAGFGISVLGAVAGIADQPLQSLTGPEAESASPARQASGLVSGVGKGLVGAFTKPLGGAAELVSQTGLGLLQGTGLTSFPVQRHAALSEPVASTPCGTLKLIEKLLTNIPDPDVLAAVDGVCLTSHSGDPYGKQQVMLLLTAEVLFVVSAVDDNIQQAYAVSELTCQGSADDPGMLALLVGCPSPSSPDSSGWVGQLHVGELPEDQINNKDRVAAFLGGSTGLGHLTREDQSGSCTVHAPVRSVNAQYEVQVNPDVRDFFLAQFTAAKNRITGIGFPL